jgi:hypothetical protein
MFREYTMRFSVRLIATLAALALPGAAIAQSPSPSDVAYCQTMAGLYQRYVIGTSGSGSFGTPDVSVAEAMTKCGSAPAGAIPVLEQALKDNAIDLPPR